MNKPTSHLRSRSALLRLVLGLSAPLMVASAQAIEFGPFTLNGFVKLEATRSSNQCSDCQRFPTEDKQRIWADELVPGKAYSTQNNSVSLMQPWLGANFDLGQGFKLSGLLSQRWRDGKPDVQGISWFEKNAAISHEEWGSVRIGAMTTRAWSVADYPYGTDIGIAYPWASSGAGYGLMTNAIRYTSRPYDLMSGDLVLEATYEATLLAAAEQASSCGPNTAKAIWRSMGWCRIRAMGRRRPGVKARSTG